MYKTIRISSLVSLTVGLTVSRVLRVVAGGAQELLQSGHMPAVSNRFTVCSRALAPSGYTLGAELGHRKRGGEKKSFCRWLMRHNRGEARGNTRG